MRGEVSQLSIDFGVPESTLGLRSARKSRRVATVRLVEFAPFPRERRDERWSLGFTLDQSAEGACLRTTDAAPVGSLLRVIVRGIDGRPTLDSIARVVWQARGSAGEVRMGIAVLAQRVRRPLRSPSGRKPAVAA